jgi:hypothetical protein
MTVYFKSKKLARLFSCIQNKRSEQFIKEGILIEKEIWKYSTSL